MDVLALVSAIAAVVAAGVAAWQAVQARGAKRDAEAARSDAAGQAQAALEEARRAVSAQEAIAAAVRRVGQRPDPWEVRPHAPGLVTLVNAGGRSVMTTRATMTDQDGQPAGAAAGTWLLGEPRTWPSGDSERLRDIGGDDRFSRPVHVTLVVHWREVDDDERVPDREFSYSVR